MSYGIFFVRRDPGQTFEDALEDLEESFEGGDPGALTDVDLENWDAILPAARGILGDLEVDEDDESSRELTARDSGVELRLISGEIEIQVPDDTGRTEDPVELMSRVYELARTVEDVTGLEGYDPQAGEPVSDQPGTGTPSRRRWAEGDDDDDDDDLPSPGPVRARGGSRDSHDAGPRRWWEVWKS